MAWTKLTWQDVGAPSLTPVNGSLTNVLRWALPILGWAIEFGPTGNAAVFRAATGNRRRLCINNNAGASGHALVRGAENATSATSWTSLFPTTAQVSNSLSFWQCGDASNVGGTPWVIYGNGVFFYLLVNQLAWAAAGYWELHCFGDVPSYYNTGYETLMTVRNTTDPAGAYIISSNVLPEPNTAATNHYWCRGINGTTLSTYGSWCGPGARICNINGVPTVRGGYLNRIVRQKVSVHCAGVNTVVAPSVLSIVSRGWMPNLWNPMHNLNSGTVSTYDTFTDTAYNPAASFRWYGYGGGSYGFIIEETDTWSIP